MSWLGRSKRENGIMPCPHKVAHRFVRLVGDPNGGQLACTQ
ncbi:hypothetical protein IQ26_04153 [Mesorhizobium tianshanense]|uniref:Uncharacterized protein n=1 Tax=Mesorhizobium tianshanense TaxID=39844 RepID=A0A562NLR9_9HYPH|nr:hypothetical protein IQ26_04153 [Mesorhizobium tianshanense]